MQPLCIYQCEENKFPCSVLLSVAVSSSCFMFSYKIFWCAHKIFQAHGVDSTIFAFVCDQKNEIPVTYRYGFKFIEYGVSQQSCYLYWSICEEALHFVYFKEQVAWDFRCVGVALLSLNNNKCSSCFHNFLLWLMFPVGLVILQ